MEDFGGAWTYVDANDVRPPASLIANNTRFRPGQAATRLGFPSAYNLGHAVTEMFNWLSNLGNHLLVFQQGTGIRIFDIASPSPVTVSSIGTGQAAKFAADGSRAYAAIFDTNGRSTTAGRVIVFVTPNFVADTLFPGPLTHVPSTPTEPGAGVVTAGSHRLAYAVRYRSGFIGRLSPDSGSGTPSLSTFTPTSFTSAGSKNLRWVLNPTTWPTGAAKVLVAMTPVANPNLYVFVPGAEATVPSGASQSTQIDINVSDDDLISFLDTNDATDHRLLLTQTTGGTAPFNPHSLFTHGERMVYITTTTDELGNAVGAAYISNRNAYQEIYADFSLVQLPGRLNITTGFSHQGVLYFLGPHWTYATQDTGGDPVEWPTPRLIDGSKGTLAVRGVELSPSGGHAWVAAESGLYAFDGIYQDLPISYYQTDQWNRINWAAAHALKIVDIPEERIMAVLAALDSATSPSHILCWSYLRGLGPTRTDFSMWTLSGYSLGSMAAVQNDLAGLPAGVAKRLELWLGPSNAAPLLRMASELDTTPYRDNGAAIAWTYRLPLLPQQRLPIQVLQHHGAHIRHRGAGSTAVNAISLDGGETIALTAITGTTAPGLEHQRMFQRVGDLMSLEFSTNAVDAYGILSGLTYYYSEYAQQR